VRVLSDPSVAIPVAATAAVATTVAIVPPLYRLVSNKIKDVIARYSAKEVAELVAIQKHYIDCCYLLEKAQHPSTLLFRDLQNTQEQEKKYPLHLEINVETKYPKLYEADFCPNNDVQYWEDHLSNQSILAHYCTETISYLCEYARQRSLKFFGRGYTYDPTNLFFDELKCWFVALSKVELNNETLENVRGRVRFLDRVFNDPNIFPPGDAEFNRKDTIKYVKEILENNVIPHIELYISRHSAREHLKNVTTNLSFIIRNSTKFLFYIFREPTINPNFILEQIQNPTLPTYKEFFRTMSGKFLNTLTRSQPFLVVFPLVGAKLELIEIERQQNLCEFMGFDKQICLPISIPNLTLHNWFLRENNSGIYPVFQQKNIMDSYIGLHGYIQQLCLCTAISNLFFELAGDGGNLLVYGCSLSEINSFIADYENFKKQFLVELKLLFGVARGYQENKIRDPKTNEEMKLWLENFNKAKETYDQILQLFYKNDKVIEDIKTCIGRVNSAEYVKEVRARLQALRNYINLFHACVAGNPQIKKKHFDNQRKISLFSSSSTIADCSKEMPGPSSTQPNNMLATMSVLVTEDTSSLIQRADCLVEAYPEEALVIYENILNHREIELRIKIEILLNRASAFFNLDLQNEAVAELKSVLELDPKNHDALFSYGRMLYQDRKYEEATNILMKFINAYPKSQFRQQADELTENCVNETNSTVEIKLSGSI